MVDNTSQSIRNWINRTNNKVKFTLIIWLLTSGLNLLYAQESNDKFIDSRDKNDYEVVTVGNQVWLAENLRFEIENSWIYKNDSTLLNKYGRLYTWNSVIKAIPKGWRLPTDSDIKELIDYLRENVKGSEQQGNNWTLIGGVLKSKEAWLFGGIGTDNYGFNALPSGYRVGDGRFIDFGEYAYFWTEIETPSQLVKVIRFSCRQDNFEIYQYSKKAGFSIRLIKE